MSCLVVKMILDIFRHLLQIYKYKHMCKYDYASFVQFALYFYRDNSRISFSYCPYSSLTNITKNNITNIIL